MALRAVADHPKLARLKILLNCGRYEAMGALEALWNFTGRYTPQGNIGKYSDAEIEAWLEWRGAPGAIISALIESGWLDRSKEHRLLVHDWHDHADDATRLSLKRKKLEFLTRKKDDPVPTVSGQGGDSVPTVSGLPEPVPVPVPGSESVPEKKYIYPSQPVLQMPSRGAALEVPEVPTAQQFLDKYVTATDIPYSEDDVRRTSFAYGALDPENKVEACAFIEEYAGSRTIHSSPQNYLNNRPWSRRSLSGLRTRPAARNDPAKSSITPRGLDWEEIA